MDWEKKYKALTWIILDMMYSFAELYAECNEDDKTEMEKREYTLSTAAQCLGYIFMMAAHDFENDDIDSIRKLVGSSPDDPCVPYMLEATAMALRRVHLKRMEIAKNEGREEMEDTSAVFS